MINFTRLHKDRIDFVKNNQNDDHVILNGDNKVLISAPHGVNQVRLGKLKYKEIGSLAVALYLRNNTNSFLIAKTKNNYDDANFDENCKYRKSIERIVKQQKIKYLLDIHGLSAKRNIDVNFGVHLGDNIKTNPKQFEKLNGQLINSGFAVSIDKPFMAGAKTISGSIKKKFGDIFTLQIEINCGITNQIENEKRFIKLLDILSDWINELS